MYSFCRMSQQVTVLDCPRGLQRTLQLRLIHIGYLISFKAFTVFRGTPVRNVLDTNSIMLVYFLTFINYIYVFLILTCKS